MSGRPDRGAPGIAALADRHGDVQVLPASFAQRRFWVLDQLDGGAAYTLPAGVRLRGPLDTEALRGALNAIVARHEALRTVFALEGDEPVQVVLPVVTVSLPVEDLRGTPAEAREDLVRARADANANAPFSLAAGPLLRASLLRLADDEHVLLLSLHHIVADGWSIGVLFGELEGAYTALIAGTEPALPPLPLQYPDFAVWQRQAMQGAAAARQIAYWTERLRNLPAIELPTDRARPPVQTLNGAHRELAIDGDTAEAVRALARREGATPYIGFLAAFVALLHRYTGQTDFAVGSLTSGRRRPEVEPLIGLFLNTLAIRAEPTAGMSFLELLRWVRDSATAAYANEDVPFEHVVDAVQPARDRSRSPIFQVAFQLLETLARDLRLPGLTASRVSGSKHTAKFELTLMLHSAPRGGLRAVLEYNTDLFDAATIDRMLAHYATLLGGVARDPGAPVGRLPLMGGEEYALVTEQWNQSADLLPDWTLPQRVLERAAAQPKAVAVRADDATLSYGDLAQRSAALATRLTGLGAGAGDRVAVCLDRTTELVVALLAVHRAGAAYVPLDAEHPPERLAHMLGDSGVRVVLTDAASVARLPAVDVPVLTLDAAEPPIDAAGAFTAPVIDPESAAYVIYTSGSTGKPKGVTVPHRALANFLASMAARPGLAEGDALVAVTTVGFDIAGLELWLPLVTGARVELASRAVAADGSALRALLETTAGSVGRGQVLMQATPATWSLLLEAGWKGAPNLVMLCGGEAWPPRLAEALLPRGCALWNVYGPTETTIWSARHRVTSAGDVPLGEPLANTTLLVLEPTGEPAPLGVPGELWIGGAGLAIGYHGRPDLTAERFVAHPRFGRLYRTGDRARRRGDGSLEYLGRLDDQIKLRGYRIELGEIESVLAVQPGVARAVVALRHDTGEPRLVAYVVLATGGGDNGPRLAALLEPLRRALPEYMVPASIVGLDALPLSPSGKVDRKALPAPDVAAPAERVIVAPRTELEAQVAEIWREVLHTGPVGVTESFFDLGGHSLLGMRVIARIEATLGVRVPLRALFESPTVAALAGRVARLVDAGCAAPARAIPRRAHPELPVPLSDAQLLLWLHEQRHPGQATYHVPIARRLRGALDRDALRRALDLVVARHEALRIVVVTGEDGVPAQAVRSSAPVALTCAEAEDITAGVAALRRHAAEPFDLARGPLFRAVLVRIAADDHLLLLLAHHMVFDGASVGVLLGDLSAAYTATREAPRFAALPTLPVGFVDVVQEERETRDAATLQRSAEFWREQLDDAPLSIGLPTDRPRAAGRPQQGARRTVMLPRTLVDAVAGIAQSHDATLFMALLASFNVLLHRYSGQKDLIVGTPLAGRDSPQSEAMIGHFVRTLPVRTRFDGDPTFAELLAAVRETCLGAFDHQIVPAGSLVRAGTTVADSAEGGYEAIFVLQDGTGAPLRLGDTAIEPLAVNLETAKFELMLSAVRVEEGIHCLLEYRADLFDADTIDRMLAHLRLLLEGAVSDPSRRCSRLPLLTGSERLKVLVEWNDTAADYPRDATIQALFAAKAAERPRAVALADDTGTVTYAELEERSNRIAHYLRGLGVAEGTFVGLALRRSPDLVAGILGILKAGGAYVPLDPEYPAERLRFMLEDSAAPVVLSEHALVDRLPATAGARLVLVDRDAARIAAYPAAPLPPAGSATSPAYVMYTSGSTGQPKGVVVPHRAVVRLARGNTFMRCDADEVFLLLAPISFDASTIELWGALLNGAKLALAPGGIAGIEQLGRLIGQHGVTALWLTAAAFRQVVDTDLEALRPLRQLLAGGDVLPVSQVQRVLTELPHLRLINGYGPTENTTFTCCHTITTADAANGVLPIGRPIANSTAYILDAAMEPVPPGVPGELYTGGDGLALGYLNRPDLTAQRFVANPFGSGSRLYKTGDRVRWRGDGVIEFLGRLDDQIKVRGFRVELPEIEATLARHDRVREAVVVARADGGGESRLVAYLVAEDGGEPATVAAMRAHLRTTLPEHMVPTAFVWLPRLPLSSNGKVDRRALPAPQDSAVDAARDFVAPRTPLEEQIAAVWAELLDRDRVGVEDDFFALGGHSLLAMRVVGHIARELQVRLTIAAVFEARTVAALAALVVQRLAVQEAAASSDAELAAMLAEVEGLSEQDATRLLAADTPEIP